ncbi:MAG: VTT domain-containing protein [Dehalococcoidia bacterium]|nr:VTT domain-containing protein [Dehalococcoidia bacterium]MDW8119979.1 VTT domain-containing protein [Chloroflexota bacterium]
MVRPYQWIALLRLTGTTRRERIQRIVALVVVALIIVGAIIFRNFLWAIRTATYPGIFLLSLVGAASIFVPIPGLASVCAGAGVLALNLWAVAALAAAGEAIGETSGYLAGIGGRTLVEKHPYYLRFYAWMRYRGGLVLFLACIIPNPLFDIVGITAGSLRYPLHLFYPLVFSGKLVKNLWISYLCYRGLMPVLRWLGGMD